MRRQIIPTILATDMAKHFQVIANFEGVMKNFDRENADHRQAVMDGLLHSADVGNPTLRFDIATVYSLRIIQEFNKQVLTEEQKGLPVSEYLRVGNDVAGIKKNQLGFIEKLIYPLWKIYIKWPVTSNLSSLWQVRLCISGHGFWCRELPKGWASLEVRGTGLFRLI